jgi:hypothetical protein
MSSENFTRDGFDVSLVKLYLPKVDKIVFDLINNSNGTLPLL